MTEDKKELGFGVYLKGKAGQMEKKDMKEVEKAIRLLYGRVGKTPRNPSEFLGNFPRRVYKFAPEKIWVNGDGEVNGNFVDARVEITKEILGR